MASLKDIAKKCSVSPTTVSRVLNDDVTLSVSSSVRNKVLEEAKRVGYKTPRRRKHGVYKIGLIIAPIDKIGFEVQVLSNLTSISLEYGISIEFFNSRNKQWDGLVILGEYSNEELKIYSSYTENIILINNLGHNEYQYDSLILDYEASERKLIDYFLSLNKKSIGYFGGTTLREGQIIGEKRALGFKAILQEKNLFEEKYFNITSMDEESGYKTLLKLEEIPEAIIFSDYEYAEGALKALKERGRTAFTVCYDNFGFCTANCDKKLVIFSDMLWHLALKHLIERIKVEREESIRIYCPANLV